MRLWSLHPKYLDRLGLLAVWREGLLAQNVLSGKTRGYRNHPQLERFKQQKDPVSAIGAYLREVHKEAVLRSYHFDRDKIISGKNTSRIKVTAGQISYEFGHLLKKLKQRNQQRYLSLRFEKNILMHPLFKKTAGSVEGWERVK